MPGNITSVTLNTTTPTPIVASTNGATIQVQEDVSGGGYPTSNFIIYHAVPPATSGASVPSALGRTIQAGSAYNFSKTLTFNQMYAPGEIVGFAKASTAGFVLMIDELGC